MSISTQGFCSMCEHALLMSEQPHPIEEDAGDVACHILGYQPPLVFFRAHDAITGYGDICVSSVEQSTARHMPHSTSIMSS